MTGDTTNFTNPIQQLQAQITALQISSAPPETTLTYASSLSWNMDTNPVAKVTLTGNVTITVSGGVAGGNYRLMVFQDGTGSRAVTLSGVTLIGTPIWATAANGVNIIAIDYSGSTRYAVVN